MSRVSIDIRGLPAVKRMLATVDDRTRQNLERRAVRAAGNIFKPALAAAAASRHGSGAGNVPASFRKVKVKVSTHGGPSGRDPIARVRPISPLFNIFEPGAGGHTIAPRRKGRLSGAPGGGGWDATGRKRGRGFYARGPVHHPGFASRALLAGVFSATVDRAETAATNIIFGHAGAAALGGGGIE
jgi:hypothetical protein